MRKKSFLVVFMTVILVCALPIHACGFGQFDYSDPRLDYYTYLGAHVDARHSPWYHVVRDNFESLGQLHCRNGTVYKCFFILIPFCGYYFVVRQSGDMHFDLVYNDGAVHTFYRNELSTVVETSFTSTISYFIYGDGYFSHQNVNCFQNSFFGDYYIFFRIPNMPADSQIHSHSSFTGSLISTPTDQEKNAINGFVGNNSGNNQPFNGSGGNVYYPSGSDSPVTNPNGGPVPTDIWGNPVPTDKNGNPVPTNSAGLPVATDINGNPVSTNSAGNAIPTYPGGRPAYTFPDGTPIPTGSDGETLPWFTTPDGSTYVQPEGMTTGIDPDTGQPITNPDTGEPVFEPVTLLDEQNQQSKVNEQFNKISNMVSDIDNVSSLMESNQAILSAHIDSTRGLVDDVLSWFPAPVIACIVCGAIMIIAVKITGSGNSA